MRLDAVTLGIYPVAKKQICIGFKQRKCGVITVYFDGKCSSCSEEIQAYKNLAPSKTFLWKDVANDPSLIEQSGINLEDALRRLHVRDKNGNLHIGVSAFILIWQHLPRLKWQTYAYLLKLPVLFHVATFGYNKMSDYRFSRLSHCQVVANFGDKTKI